MDLDASRVRLWFIRAVDGWSGSSHCEPPLRYLLRYIPSVGITFSAELTG
jgi:hypothetical protein